MNHRIALCACIAMLRIVPAWSQESGGSSVTLYGLIDQGLEYRNNAAVGNSTYNSYRMAAGTATSYFGFHGIENLGGGTQAIWDLQGGFAPNNGTSSQGGRLFGRQAYVGINGDFGRLTFGRQYTMRFFATSPSNPFGTGAQGITTLDNGVANARADNSVSYRYYYEGFEAGVNWSFGRDAVAGNSAPATNCPGETGLSKECREWSLLLKYDNKSWGIASAYERDYGGTSATWGGLTSPNLTDSRFILGGYLHVYKAKIGAGWIKRIDQGIATPRSNLVWVSGTVPVTPFFYVDAMLAQLKYEHSPNKALVEVLRVSYHFSKQTFIYLTGEHIKNGGTLALSATTITPVVGPPAGGAQISVIAGIRHVF